MSDTVICTLYKFTAIHNPQQLRGGLLAEMKSNRVRGTVLVADEGVNGTIAGARGGVDAVLEWLRRQPDVGAIETKESFADRDVVPFRRTKVKIKREIVTMGVPDLDPALRGESVDARDWNALIDDADVLVVDTRNEYEIQIGAFAGAVNPHTENFRDFPAFADRLAEELHANRHKKIAMYCTGGIRCEKSTAYLKQRGFENVYHLNGGILKYLEEVPAGESRWRGECFVFDDRVSVDHQLKKGAYDQCRACRTPLSEADKLSEHYIAGAACPHCYARTSDADRARFLERQKQMELADERGAVHLGPEAMEK